MTSTTATYTIIIKISKTVIIFDIITRATLIVIINLAIMYRRSTKFFEFFILLFILFLLFDIVITGPVEIIFVINTVTIIFITSITDII